MTKRIRVFSFGGGVQSHAVLILQATQQIEPYDYFVFANVGNDSESPETLGYINRYSRDLFEEFNIPFIETQKTTHNKPETLVQFIYRTQRSVPIPARLSNGAPGRRSCTSTFKINVVDKWIKSQQATHAIIGLGISVDEIQRMRDEQWHGSYGKRKLGFMKKLHYPLIDKLYRRTDCYKIIQDFGLPIPPKSSCFFCPFKRRNEWIDMRRNTPELFNKAVDIERQINKKRGALGKDVMYLHPSLVPLNEAVGMQQAFDFMDDDCTGYCHT